MTVDVGLAYRDNMLSEWTEMAHALEQRKLSCNLTTDKVRLQPKASFIHIFIDTVNAALLTFDNCSISVYCLFLCKCAGSVCCAHFVITLQKTLYELFVKADQAYIE